MTRRGFTVAELVIAIVVVGVLVALTAPSIGRTIVREDVRSARNAVVAMHAKAKASAVQRGRRTVLLLSGGDLVIRAPHPVTGVLDTVDTVERLDERYHVGFSATRDSLVFDPRGLGTESGPTTVVVTKGAYADTVVVSAAGRVIK